MELLVELLKINEQTAEDQLIQLFEDLGNLKKLNIGSMINAFKQSYYRGSKGQNGHTTEVENKFRRHYGIGKESEIIESDVQIKNWGGFRKVIEGVEGYPVGAVINLDKKPVAVVVLNGTELKYKNETVGVAWDFSKTGLSDEVKNAVMFALENADGHYNRKLSKIRKDKSETDSVPVERFYRLDKVKALEKEGKTVKGERQVPVKDYETWYDAMKDGGAKVNRDDKLVTATLNDLPIGEWNKETGKGFIIYRQEALNAEVSEVYGKPKQIQGISHKVEQLRSFVEALTNVGVVTLSVVMVDKEGQKKNQDRLKVGGPAPREVSQSKAKEALNKRLAFYKASKLETAEDAFDFMKKVFSGKAKQINFEGNTYSAIPSANSFGSHGKGYQIFTDTTMKDLITGKPVAVKFEADRAKGEYSTLTIGVKLVNGSLQVVSVNGKTV